MPGVTISPNPFKSDKPFNPLVARIECQVIQRSHTLVPDIGGQYAFGSYTTGMVIGLRAATDEGEDILLWIKEKVIPAWAVNLKRLISMNPHMNVFRASYRGTLYPTVDAVFA